MIEIDSKLKVGNEEIKLRTSVVKVLSKLKESFEKIGAKSK